MCRWFYLPIVLIAVCGPVHAQPPVLFFSDMVSGPNTGGENGNGAYVTIYGNYLGAAQGASTVTAGGGPMVNCRIWGSAWLWYQKIACQLGPRAAGGSLIVTVDGQSSNPLPFTVAAGNIYFVSTAGSDSNAGTFAAPWQTLLHARNAMLPGDITYAMNGVTQSTDDGTGWDAAFLLSGINQGNWCSPTGYPRALAAYPGAAVTIGNPTGGLPDYGLRTSDCQGNWVFSGISFRGQAPAQPGSGSNYRFSGSDITCPYSPGIGGGACFLTSQASGIDFYGNHVYNAGAANASALFQAVYFSTDSNQIDMGWNLVEYVHGCRGVQVHSSPLGSGGPQDPTGHDQYNISIHDNTIHDTQCDGLIVDTVDPSQGPVTVYNNVIYNAGIGPDNPEATGAWNCIDVPGGTENGPAGSGTVEVFNNTLFACGTFASPPYSNDNSAIAENGDEPSGAPPIYVDMVNNLIESASSALYPGGVPYVVVWDPQSGSLCSDSQICPWLFGTNNLMSGAGAPVTNLTEIVATIAADPLLVSTSVPDLHLTSASPAIQAGALIGSIGVFGANNTGRDQDGLPRGATPSIGAYEFGNPGGAQGLLSPAPGITLSGSLADFTWDEVSGAPSYRLTLGTTEGSANIFSGSTAGTSQTVTGIPCTGGTVYVELAAELNGSLQPAADYSYQCRAGFVDFNGDGHADVIWQDPITGWAQVWYLGGSQGVSLLGAANLTQANSWQIVGAADFDGNGAPDVVWQDPVSGRVQVWYLGGPGGTALMGSLDIAGPNPWRLASIADFNGDGHPDLLWQNRKTGLAQIWYMGGTQGNVILSAADLTVANPWLIAGAADFNGDGHPDILWQDPVSGATQIWYMAGAQGNQFLNAANAGGPNPWRVVAIADFNLDGHPDLVWQDPMSGASAIWFMTGAQGTLLQGTATLSGPNPWRIGGPN
ncbi:MAG: FG-GAP-like repeat-containing protein [Bryobacteraceae bacterium]|jgi:hypothetical protein